MKCEEVETLMIDYLDSKLDEENNLRIEKHIETCERCLDDLREFQEVLKQMSGEEMIKPDDSLRINFYHMLHNEIKKSEGKKITPAQNTYAPWYNIKYYRIAAGVALLICGTFLGVMIHSGIGNSNQAKQLKQLQSEVTSLRKTAMLTMLKNEFSSNRIQAVNFAGEIDVPDENVINALIETLNNDRNVNVRMAAAYALAKFTNLQSVRDSLVKSLTRQNDPILQVTLINILVDLKEKNALKPIENIISDEKTMQEVKSVAENGAKLLRL